MQSGIGAGRRPRPDAAEGEVSHGPEWLWMASVAAVIVVLALLLTHYSMWRDEALTAELMSGSFGKLVETFRETRGSEAAQTLYFVLLWPWARLFGTSEVALRLPSLMATIATGWVLVRVLYRLGVGSRAHGAWYVLLLPVMIWYSLEARPYALIVLLVALHLLASLRLLQGDSRTAVPLAVCTMLVTAAYTVAGCAAILAFIVVVWRQPRTSSGEGGAARVAEGLALMGSLFLIAFAVGKTSVSGVPKGRSPVLSLAYAGYEVVTGRSIGFSVSELRTGSLGGLVRHHPVDDLVLALVIAALAVLVWRGLAGLAAGRRRDVVLLAAPWLVGALCFTLYGLVTEFPLLGRHLLFALPAAFVLVAVGLATRSAREWVAAGAVVSVVAAVALAGMVFSSRHEKDDFRRLDEVLSACELTPANTVIAAPVDGVEYYNEPFTDVPLLTPAAAVERVAKGDSEAAVVDFNHMDPEGASSLPIARTARLKMLEITDLRVFSRRSLEECSDRAGAAWGPSGPLRAGDA